MSGVKSQRETDSELKANRARLLIEKASVTGKISDTCRFVGFGLLAVFYTITVDHKSPTSSFEALPQCLVLAIGLFGGFAIFFDYLQYLCGFLAVEHALTRELSYDYDKSRWHYRGRVIFYYAKQFAVGMGVLSLIAAVLLISFESAPL